MRCAARSTSSSAPSGPCWSRGMSTASVRRPRARKSWLAAKRMEEAAFGLVRARNRAVPRDERRGQHRRHRGVRHLLARPAAGRIPARLSAAFGRPDVRDAICGRAAARGRSRDPARSPDQSRRQGRAARPHPFDARGGAVLSRVSTARRRRSTDLRKHRLAMQFADQTKSQETAHRDVPGCSNCANS